MDGLVGELIEGARAEMAVVERTAAPSRRSPT